MERGCRGHQKKGPRKRGAGGARGKHGPHVQTVKDRAGYSTFMGWSKGRKRDDMAQGRITRPSGDKVGGQGPGQGKGSGQS